MTVEEIFSTVINHMAEGVVYHKEFVKAYDFLGLWGFSECHTYHQFEEAYNYRRFYHYYATHYFKLIPPIDIKKPEIIPASWYKYSSSAVDNGTKKTAIKELMNKWVEWERSTKQLYQEMYNELIALKEIDAARKLHTYIHDVSTELHDVEKQILTLESINYDLITITEWSDKMKKEYKKKLER